MLTNEKNSVEQDSFSSVCSKLDTFSVGSSDWGGLWVQTAWRENLCTALSLLHWNHTLLHPAVLLVKNGNEVNAPAGYSRNTTGTTLMKTIIYRWKWKNAVPVNVLNKY